MSQISTPLIRNRETIKSVRNSLKSAQKLSQQSFHQLTKAVLDYLSKGLPLEANQLSIVNELNLTDHESKLLIQNLIILLRHCLRYRTSNRSANLIDILSDELRLSKDFGQLIQNQIESVNSMTSIVPYGPKLPSCRSIKWRIDVVISSCSLSKVLEPLIIFEILTDSDQRLRFDCSLTKFNQLRLAVAASLSELHRLEEKRKFYPSLRANTMR
ncbi:COMM domain-containing protein 5-like [Panonychus citri]|uniref:COMM domain-containing protein 5-like n=1 Tax=Panonychus citri TaxID=50023 RepID=UPI002307BAB2|nr:COMM domain-containing protein 5-like [Panonychus citri]